MAAFIGTDRRENEGWRSLGIRGRIGGLLAALSATVALAIAPALARNGGLDDPRPGYRATAQAIKGAKIMPTPDSKDTIEVGTIVIREGVIEAVGPTDKVTIPDDAEVIDGKGLVVTAGFVDLYTTLGAPPAGATRSTAGPAIPLNYAEYALRTRPRTIATGSLPSFRRRRRSNWAKRSSKIVAVWDSPT